VAELNKIALGGIAPERRAAFVLPTKYTAEDKNVWPERFRVWVWMWISKQ
jgi:hypothetical protein